MGKNILLEDATKLVEVYEKIKKLDDAKNREKELSKKEEELEKRVSDKKKLIQTEIESTIKSRREEVLKTFIKEEEKIKELKDKTNKKREQYKNSKISERISYESKEFIDENKRIAEETKKYFKDEKVPSIYNTEFYYALFMPSSVKDVFFCILSFIIIFAVLPLGLYQFLPSVCKIYYMLGVINIACVIIFGGLYLYMYSLSRTKYRRIVEYGSANRKNIKRNKKIIRQIKKDIIKDKDDSKYGLEDYNKKIQNFEEELEELSKRRMDSLKIFDETTKDVILREIEEENSEHLKTLEDSLRTTEVELSKIRDVIKALSIEITEKYEVFLGKEFVNQKELEKLIEFSKTKDSSTKISELLKQYKEDSDKPEEVVKNAR